MYLIAITFSLCVAYTILLFLFPVVCGLKSFGLSAKSIRSLTVIFLLSFIGYAVAFNISDPEMSNRFLHGFGGGFMSYVVCFLAVKDSRIVINRFRFFILSILFVTGLGVVNEILEFFLQNYLGLIFATSINDTWLDLISNTVGLLIAGILLTPFVKGKVL